MQRNTKPLNPKRVPDSWDWLDAVAGTLDEDFLKAVLENPTNKTSASPRARVNKRADVSERPKSRR